MIRLVRQDVIPNEEINNQKRITVPDMTESVDEMLRRFRRGDLGLKTSVYNGEAELPDLRKLDLTEVDEFKRSITNDIQNAKSKKSNLERQIKAQKQKASEQKPADANESTI